jgi:hypothetical protein
MNYQNIYESLITKRQNTPATGYTERHHILPKSMGGSDDPSNLVVLTGREHWVAHLLLYKIHRNSQTVHACNMMAMRCEERGIPYIKSSRLYEIIRIEHSKRIGQWTAKKGEANSQYGTMWICNVELEENKKISKDDIIPEGWIKGRNKWKPKYKQVFPIKQCVKCGNDFRGKGTTCSRSCASKRPMLEETKKKLSKTLSKPRPYRVGLKYKKKL